jgi:hypothetical protein
LDKPDVVRTWYFRSEGDRDRAAGLMALVIDDVDQYLRLDPDNSFVACDRCSNGPAPAKLPVYTVI